MWVKWIMGDIWESTRTFLNGVLINKRGMQSAKTGIEVGREQNFKPVGRKHQQVFVLDEHTLRHYNEQDYKISRSQATGINRFKAAVTA